MGHPGRDDSIYARESIRIEAIKKMTSVWKITDDIDGIVFAQNYCLPIQ